MSRNATKGKGSKYENNDREREIICESRRNDYVSDFSGWIPVGSGRGPLMKCNITKYNRRNWAVWLEIGDDEHELVAVTVYKKGAEVVKKITDALIKTREISHANTT